MDEAIGAFLAGRRFALLGLSRTGYKIGNRIYRELTAAGYELLPVHPEAEEIEGVRCYPELAAIPGNVDGVILNIPPVNAEGVVREAAALGIGHIWMQQGAESREALAACRELGLNCVSGHCILMAV